MSYGGFLGGDGWSLSAGDETGDTDNKNSTGDFNTGASVVIGGSSGGLNLNSLVIVGALVLGFVVLRGRK